MKEYTEDELAELHVKWVEFFGRMRKKHGYSISEFPPRAWRDDKGRIIPGMPADRKVRKP